MKPAPVSSENMAPLPLQIFTVRHSKHEKQRTFSENRKTLETSESAPQTSEMPSEASETHRKGIGKTSERHRKGSSDPSKCICFDVPRRPGHRKGIGKASENIWKYWKAWGNIGKHRKTSDPPWKNLNKDGNSRSLSDSLICSTKQPHWRHLEIAVFCILTPCLFAQQSRLIGCSWQTSPPKENCSQCLVHWRHMRLSIISLRLPGFQN